MSSPNLTQIVQSNQANKIDTKSSDVDSNWLMLFICWLLATGSALGSLFFSEILKYPPCNLCWYQRICLFPLVFIFFAGLFPLNKSVIRFSLPLTVTGLAISFYHNLLYTGIIPKAIQPCDEALSCTEIHLGLFGFVTIPMLSFLAFSILTILLILLNRRLSR